MLSIRTQPLLLTLPVLMASSVLGQTRAPAANTAFDRLDTNRDGFVDRAEFERAAYDAWNAGNIDPLWRRSEGREGGRGAGEGDNADPAEQNRPRQGAGGAGRIRESFDRLDTNKDGSLTAEEYNADRAILARRPFAEVDANKDGKLSYDEVAAVFGGAGQRRPRGGN